MVYLVPYVALVLGACGFGARGAAAGPLHTSGRWIVDANQERFKLRCVNWAGHMETNIPEGLQYQTVSWIASWIAQQGFNCVRLTYSIDMALSPNTLVSDSFNNAASAAGVSQSDMQSLYNTAKSKNSFLSSATTLSTYATVIDALGNAGVSVILDNHVSKAQWCCDTSDGNGWWASASGYNDANSRYFDTNNWLNGLSAMATFSQQHSNVVGMSLRNELRATGSQDGNSHADWYSLVAQGAQKIHSGNSNLLVVIGGVNYATDLDFLYGKQLDTSSWANRTVWEFHHYEWTDSGASCSSRESLIGNEAGYLLTQNKAYTGPLWLSEFGLAQVNPSAAETSYMSCIREYMESNDAEWSIWALQGSYYVRNSQINFSETFGLLNDAWTGWRNSSFPNALGNMLKVTQGP
jgi:endoglucanase